MRGDVCRIRVPVQPDFTVGLVVGERRERAAHCLKTLLSQNILDRMEIRVADIARDRLDPLPGSNHPQVQVVRMPGATYAQARLRVVQEAAGRIVGFIEEHAWAFDGWAEAILEAHNEPWAGVGAEVHIGNPKVPHSNLIGVMNHHPWMAPATRGTREHLPGHNSAYKKEVLLRYGDRLLPLLRAELALCTALRRDGHQLFLETKAKFAHVNETGIASPFRGYYYWNRCYADSRAKEFGWSLSRRLFYAACTPLMPVYYLCHVLPQLRRERPDLYPIARAGIHRLYIAQLGSAIGHTAGLLFGLGDAEQKFSEYETSEYRQLDPDAYA
jgi:hypothetical protein